MLMESSFSLAVFPKVKYRDTMMLIPKIIQCIDGLQMDANSGRHKCYREGAHQSERRFARPNFTRCRTTAWSRRVRRCVFSARWSATRRPG